MYIVGYDKLITKASCLILFYYVYETEAIPQSKGCWNDMCHTVHTLYIPGIWTKIKIHTLYFFITIQVICVNLLCAKSIKYIPQAMTYLT